jgi:carboxyl-terminal processing protease
MLRSALRLKFLLGLLLVAAIGIAQTTPPPTQTPPQQEQTAAVAPFDAARKAEILKGLEDIVTKRAFVPGVDFSMWPSFVEKKKTDIDKAESEADFTRVMNGILHDFGISHIRFRTPKAAESRTSGTTSGLGIQVKKVDAGLEVTAVLPAGPGGQVGLEAGDIIKEIEKKPASDPRAIQVEEGKTLSCTVLKKNGETKEITLENKRFSSRRPETLTWIADDAAVLKLYSFSNGYDRKNIERLVGEVNGKAKYLIIDLRSNGGGAVSNLNHFLSLLMPSDTPVGTFVSRSTMDAYQKEKQSKDADPIAIAAWAARKFKTNKRPVEPFTGKIAVLINRGSASASEIAAAALKDCRDAVLVGQRSMGAVLASVYGKLPGGFELQYPVQDYVTIKGVRLEGNPREPDLVLGRSADGKDDGPDKALELMKKREQEHSNTDSGKSGGGHKLAA